MRGLFDPWRRGERELFVSAFGERPPLLGMALLATPALIGIAAIVAIPFFTSSAASVEDRVPALAVESVRPTSELRRCLLKNHTHRFSLFSAGSVSPTIERLANAVTHAIVDIEDLADRRVVRVYLRDGAEATHNQLRAIRSCLVDDGDAIRAGMAPIR